MVALYPLTLWFAFLTLRRVLPFGSIAPVWGITAMAAVPMFTLVHSYYTNDAPAIAASTVATFALVRAHQSQFAIRDTLLLGFALGLVGLHKYTGFLMFPVTAATLTWHFHRRPYILLRRAAAIFTITAVMASWWYVRNWTLYSDPLGIAFTQTAVDSSGQAPIPPRARGLSPIDFVRETNWLAENYATFWAGYGHERLKLPGAAYLALLAFLVTAAVGLCIRMVRLLIDGTHRNESLILAIMAILHFGLWFVSFWSSYTVDVALHGRYVFPTLLALVILCISGYRQLLSWAQVPPMLAISTIPILVNANAAYFIHSVLPDVSN